MALSFSLTQVERFRREAKKLKRERSITHNEALDRIAQHNGFSNWSLLAKHSDTAIASTTAESLSESRDSRKRYYLHGDVVEGEPNKCYCARCDDFWNLDHFQPTSWHKDGNDVERFLYSLANWNKLTPSRKGNLYRPTKVPNVLQQAIEITRTLHEAARSPFHKWLESQINRNDQIGDLAKDVLRDKGFPLNASTRNEVENYLSRHGNHIIRAVRKAWREYQSSSKKTLAQALADELNISVSEAEELTAVEPQELTGHSDEMIYSYLFNFADHASPRLSAKLLKKRGSMQLEVGPEFFELIQEKPMT
jgi:uncharacterized protein YozE (UPF0346 family)